MSLYGPGRASLTHGFEMSSRTICCQISLLGFEALLHVWSFYELELLSDSVPVRDEFRRTRLDTKLDAIGYADARRRIPGREEDFECGGVQGLVR